MKARIRMITLGVADLEKSIKFYEEGLGPNDQCHCPYFLRRYLEEDKK